MNRKKDFFSPPLLHILYLSVFSFMTLNRVLNIHHYNDLLVFFFMMFFNSMVIATQSSSSWHWFARCVRSCRRKQLIMDTQVLWLQRLLVDGKITVVTLYKLTGYIVDYFHRRILHPLSIPHITLETAIWACQ